MKKLILLLPLFLIACSEPKPSPTTADTYFAAKYAYTVVLAGVVGYKEVCAKQPRVAHCHAVVAKIRKLDNAVKAAEDNMDAAILSGDTSNQQKALSAYTGATSAFKTYKEENVND